MRILPPNELAERASIELFASLMMVYMAFEYLFTVMADNAPSLGLTIFISAYNYMRLSMKCCLLRKKLTFLYL